MAWDAAGCRVTGIASVTSFCPSLLLPGPLLLSCPPSVCSDSISPVVGGLSTPPHWTGKVALPVDFQPLYQMASTRFSEGKLPLSVPPPFFLCPVVEVFSNSVVFSMQINYFKNCFCKYLCEYFSIVFDNIQHFHDLVIAFAGVFKIP